MLILAAIGAVVLFLASYLLGEIYVPIAAVILLLLVNIALLLSSREQITKKNLLLMFWFVLLAHRSFIPRASLSEAGSLFFVEVAATLAVFFGSAVILALSVSELRLRIFEGRFWLIAYTTLAGVSLIWTPVPFYSGFWLIRLICIVIIVLVYFSNAEVEDCRRFFLVTLLGSAPVILLPIIGYATGTATGQLGQHRISGYWFHPSVVSMAAFSVAAASLTVMFQRDNRSFLLHAVLLLLSCTSGFLTGGKTGAVGGALAFASMLLVGRRFRLWFGTLAVVTIGYAVYVLVLQDLEIGLFVQFQDYNLERLNTIQSRFNLWLGALKVWADSVPTALFGRGFTSFRAAPLSSTTGWAPGQAHSSYVNLLVDAGLVGTLFFLAMLGRPIAGAIAAVVREGREFAESQEFPVFIALIPLVIGGTVDDAFGGTLQPTSYLTIGIAITLDRLLYLRRLADRPPTEAPSDVAEVSVALPNPSPPRAR